MLERLLIVLFVWLLGAGVTYLLGSLVEGHFMSYKAFVGCLVGWPLALVEMVIKCF